MSVRGTSCNLLYAGKGAPAAKGSFPSKESQKHDWAGRESRGIIKRPAGSGQGTSMSTMGS